MENYRCVSVNCDKCNICDHYNVKKFDEDDDDIIIEEDLSDICLPGYRLYSDTDPPYRHYPCKGDYNELFFFYDNECDGDSCLYQKDYDKTVKCQSSCIKCKLGDHITCTSPKHPTNKMINIMWECFKAEEKAFEKAGITEGIVTYTCPLCGGEAVASRYLHEGSYHGLGSGCKKCGTWHT